MSKETNEEIKARIEEQYKDLPEGVYLIEVDNFKVYSGKQGYIEFKIALTFAVNELINKYEINSNYNS